jgi:outer membrane receptor protein involved in Fe transport
LTYQAKGWLAAMNFKYSARRSDEFYDDSFVLQEATLQGYALVNVHLEVKFSDDRLRLFMDGRNLLDSRYQETYGYATPGLNGDIGLRLTFRNRLFYCLQ